MGKVVPMFKSLTAGPIVDTAHDIKEGVVNAGTGYRDEISEVFSDLQKDIGFEKKGLVWI